ANRQQELDWPCRLQVVGAFAQSLGSPNHNPTRFEPSTKEKRGPESADSGPPRGSDQASAFADSDQYMSSIPPCPPAAPFSSLGMSATRASEVSRRVATLAAFWRAERVTLVGSMMPALTRSVYSSFSAS